MIHFFQIKGLNLNKVLFFLVVITGLNVFSKNTLPTGVFPPSYSSFLLDDCDACGCSNNGGSLGMGGVLDNNFVGVRYLFQKYQSKDGIFIDSPKIDEYFNTVQIWSRIPVFKNIEVQAFIPFHFHSREYSNKTTKIEGLGDISLLVNYTVIDKKQGDYDEKKDKTSMINHLVKVGVGVKLPTGKYDQTINNTTNPSFQLGTGSVDYISSLQYVFKYNSFGVTSMLNYYIKNKNDKDYKFGNQFNFNSIFFYVFKDNKKRAFVPSLGVSGEFFDKNKQFGLTVKDTNGYAVFSSVGLEYNSKRITVGASSMYPISQNLVQGKVDVKFRSALYLNYNF